MGLSSKNVDEAKKFSTDKITVKTERKAPVLHVLVGKTDQDSKEIVENINEIVRVIGKIRFVKTYLCPTMGPSVKFRV